MFKWRRIFLLSILIIITACTPKFDKLFRSSCSAPCWYGVTPGVTTKSELIQLIPGFPYYQEQEIAWCDENYIYSSAVPESLSGSFSMVIDNLRTEVSIDYQNNLVTDIGFYSGLNIFWQHIDLGLDLDDIINLYGEPNFIFVSDGCGGDVICRNLNLIYSEKGILVAVESSDSPKNFHVLPTLPVVSIVYFQASTDFKASLVRLPNISSVECDPTSYFQAWQGFETIKAENTFNGCK